MEPLPVCLNQMANIPTELPLHMTDVEAQEFTILGLKKETLHPTDYRQAMLNITIALANKNLLQVFVAKESAKNMEKILVGNGKSMTKWYQCNLLKVHCDKYQAMVLGNPKGERNVDLDICGIKVKQTQSIKILGVNLDDDLNFRDHIHGMCKKVGAMTIKKA